MNRLFCLLILPALLAADWPQYRGPNRDDVSKETGLLKSWPKDGPPLAWTFDGTGVGYSGPAVVGNKLFITGGIGDDELLICLDLSQTPAKQLWTAKLGPTFRFKGNNWAAGPSSTPTVDGTLVYALGGNGDLICAEISNGTIRWQKNLPKDLDAQVNPIGGGPRNLGWGFTWAPLVDGDNLICLPGGPKGTVAALDKKTGEVRWRSTGFTDQAAYTSPMHAEFGGVKQYVVLTNPGLAGVAAADGKLLWKQKRSQAYGTEVINTPIIQNDRIYTTVAAGNGGCEVVRIAKAGEEFKIEPVYATKDAMNHHGNMVRLGDHVFGSVQSGGWVCQEFKTGNILWSERRKLGPGAITAADGRLYCFSENDGSVALIEANDKEWLERGRFKIPQASKQRQPQGKIWTPPVVSNGKLFLRDQELLFCFDVKAK